MKMGGKSAQYYNIYKKYILILARKCLPLPLVVCKSK